MTSIVVSPQKGCEGSGVSLGPLVRRSRLKGEGQGRIKAQHVRGAATGPTDRAGGASPESGPLGFSRGAQILGTKAGKEEYKQEGGSEQGRERGSRN